MSTRRVAIVAAIWLTGALVAADGRQARDARFTPDGVKAEFTHAWKAYRQYAWGHDELRPLSRQPHDWYEEPLLITQVDALDSLVLLGFKAEADETREYIGAHLSFDRDVSVKVFEIVIRMLGGLLSSYQMTGDSRLLALAQDLGDRLLPAFDSPTGLPYRYVNLRTHAVNQAETNPAEAGTLLLEFGTLSKLTGRPVYYDKAKHAVVEIYRRRSALGLVGQRINAETGQWTVPDSHVSAEIDSYYEYLFKAWRLFGDRDCKDMWNASLAAINKYLADEVNGRLWYGHADMQSGARTLTHFGALDAYFPALLAISGDTARAARLESSAEVMWKLHGIEPETLDYRTMTVVEPGYPLRPEIVESAYYLHRLTGKEDYRRMGARFFADFVRWCRNDTGYAALDDVVSKKKADSMESFIFAETFKYFYLLSAPASALDFSTITFTTEAHPLRRTW
jgi:mannosidase alpha-like ER degradation enhancer 2